MVADLFTEVPSKSYPELIGLLFPTYPCYNDRLSRRAVQTCLQDDGFYPPNTHEMVNAFEKEAAKTGLAPTVAFVLVEWAAIFLQHCVKSGPKAFEDYGMKLVMANARCLETCLSSEPRARESVRKSALVVTRRALRNLFRAFGEPVVTAIVGQLTAKNHPVGIKSAVFLGVVAGVSARMYTVKPAIYSHKHLYYAFYREIIGSRCLVSEHLSSALSDFFANFTTAEDLQLEIAPILGKALLRAPEVVLNDLMSPLIESLPIEIDLAETLALHLIKPLLSAVKSQNMLVRDGAMSAFAIVIRRCRNEQYLGQIVDEILTPLASSKITLPEQKAIHAQMLSLIPNLRSKSPMICEAMCRVLTKDPNEKALDAEVAALTSHVIHLFTSPSIPSPASTRAVIDVIQKGLSDKKQATRKTWAFKTGDLLFRIHDGHTSREGSANELMKNVTPELFAIYDEVMRNPLAASHSGLVAAAFVPISLATVLLEFQNKTALANTIFLNHRVYTKLTNHEDLRWAVRALSAGAKNLDGASIDVQNAWGQAFIYMITALEIPPAVQQKASGALTDVYIEQRAIVADIIISGLWNWNRHVESEVKDTAAMAAKTGDSQMALVVRSICPPSKGTQSRPNDPNLSIIYDQLINMLVLSRPEILPRVHWIELCMRMGQDPGSLAQRNAERCLKKVDLCLTSFDGDAPSANTRLAAFNTGAELAFVAPDTITPLLVRRIKTNLPSKHLSSYSATDIAIARTPEGTPFVDVLSNKSQNQILDKNSRDYDTFKWEAEVRSQIAQKNRQAKKFTADEKARVNAQIVKEAAIRQEVRKLEDILRIGIGYIHALAVGPPTEAALWLGSSLKALIEVISAGAGRLVGDAADEAYLACANFVSSRLGSLRPFIGVATLRALGSSLPFQFEQEPLGALVTRVLYRIRFTSEQRPFDNVSLVYMLPLIFAILRQAGIGHLEADEADEQITLALEFLGYHTDNFTATELPRDEILALLIESMQRFSQHYKIIKDCLADMCRAIASNMSADETSTILKGTIVPQPSVRTSVLQAIREDIDLTDLDFCPEIWLASHDDVEENAALGYAIWQENALESGPKDAVKIVPYLASKDKQLRRSASRSLAQCIQNDRAVFSDILEGLKNQYIELAKPRVPERDAYGMPKKTDLADPWEARSGVALAFKEMASVFDPLRLVSFVEFLVKDSVIGDRNTVVREEMIDSATTVIALHGAANVEEIMTMFEAALDESDKSSKTSDLVSEAVVILYGALARHLREGDERVPQVVNRLLMTLATPSETVQYAVAGCLPPLIQTSSQKTSGYIQSVLDQLLQSKRYAARRGAAYGLAGIVKGKGISALREYRIMSTLRGAIDNKKDTNHRQGALFAYELLALILGQVFEPYIIQIVPQLLTSFGDSTADVREACLDTSKTCFAHLSSYGVKIILPTLLDGLEESQWRSKKGACDLLGAMAYLDPQQLAVSLPDIIPPLTNVLNDSHKEVRAAANRSLQRFGEVISNPEVKGLVGILLRALSDPTKYTDDALEALIKVSFIHYLDSPSLALIVRILQRGLGDRSATKRKAAQIIGSLAHLTERKDVTIHLPILVAGLKLAIVDPVPATRATASKALGSLVEKLGEDALPDLIPSLMTTLKSDSGAGDRLGSAQALSEVLAGLGTGRLEDTLPTILQNVASSKPTVREGFMSLFIYLPVCFGNSFASYLSRIIPPILSGLADDVESIRETSLRAGRLLVKNFATKAIDLLLPELDRGLADNSYRIRLSSVELVGDLLFNLTGITGKIEGDEEDEGAAEAGQSLLEVLGEEKRNKILSSLYICRCDTSGLVRSAAINVWKALVATPRILKELVPTLTQLLIRRLASSNMEQKVIAGNALGELIRKAGEGVLASLLPTLEEGLQTSTDVDNKQGICIALREIIASASPEALEDYEKTLVSVVRIALVDGDEEVRETAAEAFDSLQKILGKKAVDQVLPYLLNLLRTEDEADTALAALLTLLTDNTRSNIILPNLVPTLLVSPITPFNAKAIASLSEVAGPAMTRRLPAILNALMDNIVVCKNDALRSDLEDSFDAILLSVDEFDGLNTTMAVILALVKNDDHQKRSIADVRLSNFFANSDIDFSRYHQDLIRVLLISFDDSDPDVVKAAWLALSELTKRLKKEEMESLVFSTHQILQQVGVAGANLPGFQLPKGISAVLPIFLQGLMNGTVDQRTHAALAISDIVDRSSPDSLKPFVTQITGPLIRVVSERSVDVKSAILLTLNNLLGKIPTFLKPFLPQLQRTFAKSLADTTSEVLRSRAARALGTLITLTPRIDPLIAELVTGSKAPDAGVQNAMLRALYEVVSKAGTNMSETSRNSVLGLIDSDTSNADDSMAITYARLLGALIKSLPATYNTSNLIKTRVLASHMTDSSILSLNSVLLECPTTLIEGSARETPTVICHGIRNKNPFISDNSVLAAGKYLLVDKKQGTENDRQIIETLAGVIQPGGPVDTRRLALVVIRTVSRSRAMSPYLKIIVPPIFASLRDIIIPVKLAAEAAFLSIFSVVESESEVFDQYIAETDLIPTMKRSMEDYFKRVALRLGSQARERKEAEGGQGGLGLSNDEREDEKEVWSVGKVDLGENAFNND